MFGLFKRDKLIKSMISDLRCLKEYLVEDSDRYFFSDYCFTHYIFINNSVPVHKEKDDFELFVSKKEIDINELNNYADKLMTFLNNTPLEMSEIVNNIVENKI